LEEIQGKSGIRLLALRGQRRLGFGINPKATKEAFDLVTLVREEDWDFEAFGNHSATWCACCGEDRGRQSCTLVGCK
jgi:hypothetical protein